MGVKQLRFGKGFSVAMGNRRAQGATMVIEPRRPDGDELPRGRSGRAR